MLAAAICVDAGVTAVLSKLRGVFTLKMKISFFPATTNSNNLCIFPIYNDKKMHELVNKLVARSYQHLYG